MAAFVNINRKVQLAVGWTGTAPGPTVVTPAGTLTTPSDFSSFLVDGAAPAYSANMVDVTNFGSLGYTAVIPGLTSGDDLVLDFNSDQAAAAANVIIRTTLGGIARPGAAPIYIDVMPTNAVRSATNPSFVAACFISKYSPYSGSVGSRAAGSLTLTITGTFIDLVA